jgi:hypothetical protein
MADTDAELNAAIVAFFRGWCLRAGEESPDVAKPHFTLMRSLFVVHFVFS